MNTLFNNKLTTYLDTRPALFEIVFWLSLILLLLICSTLLYLFVLRVIYWRKLRMQQLVRERWLPAFKAYKASKPHPLPHFSLRTRAYVLELWTEQRALADKNFASQLDSVASALNLSRTVESILLPAPFDLFAKKVWLQDGALTAAQWLDTPSIRRGVALTAQSDDLYIALRACLCLSKRKAAGYEEAIITLIFRFPEQTSYISSHLSRDGGAAILLRLEPFLDRLPAYTVLNFISLSERSNDRALLPLLETRLKRTENTDEQAAILRSIGRLGDERQRALIIPFITHESMYLRIQAVKALGRLGNSSDIEAIVPCLSSPEWWLRYRSARAIIKLLDRDQEAFNSILTKLNDPFAIDILKHAYAELEWQMT